MEEPYLVADVVTLVIDVGAMVEAGALEGPMFKVRAEGRDLAALETGGLSRPFSFEQFGLSTLLDFSGMTCKGQVRNFGRSHQGSGLLQSTRNKRDVPLGFGRGANNSPDGCKSQQSGRGSKDLNHFFFLSVVESVW